MRVLVVVVLMACGGSKPPPQQPMSNQVAAAAAPPAEPASACGCTSDRCRETGTRWVKAVMCRYRERMCACHDKTCGDGVNAEFTHWMEDMAKQTGAREAERVTEQDAKQVADDATKYQECYMHVVGASPPTSP